jgi:hypothetical protein
MPEMDTPLWTLRRTVVVLVLGFGVVIINLQKVVQKTQLTAESRETRATATTNNT